MPDAPRTPPSLEERQAERDAMVGDQIRARGVTNARVLEVMRRIPRHRFLPDAEAPEQAYADGAQAIGERQTISQPYIVALMTESLALLGGEKALEVGAGSGYQTAILAALCAQVVAIERHASLAEQARETLDHLGIMNVRLHVGDGSRGWPADAPYDAILVAAVAPTVPTALVEQLAPGGRLVLPVGEERGAQRLLLLTKASEGAVTTRDLGEVAFVPLVGAQGFGLPDDLGAVDV